MSDRIADLTELEMAFAKDPTSLAFLELSAAYLSQNRFMEAMVVCKKGLRSHPTHLEGRLLLAKVYAGQGKLPKALTEVDAALNAHPEAPDALYWKGEIHSRAGREADAIAEWKRAIASDPTHSEALSSLKEKGIEVAPPPPPAIPASVMQAPPSLPPQAAPPVTSGSESPPPVSRNEESAARTQTPAPVEVAAPAPNQASPAQQSAAPSAALYLGGYDPVAEFRARSKGPGFGFTFGLGTLLLVFLVILVMGLRSYSERQEAIASQLKMALQHHAKDTTASLRLAAGEYGKVLELDDEHERAVPNLAHVHALLRYERGDLTVDEASRASLLQAQRLFPDHPATVAAQMLQQLAQQKIADAQSTLQAFRGTLPPNAAVPTLVRVIEGKLYRQSGRLDELKTLLEDLRKITTHPGQLAWMGSIYRHLGDPLRAREAFELAIRKEPDHDAARAQRALLLLEVTDLSNLPIALDDVTHLQDLGKSNVGPRQFAYATLARGEIQRVSGRQQEFERDLSSASEQLRRDADVLYFGAQALAADDKNIPAIEKLQEAVSLDPYRMRPWATLIRDAADAKRLEDAERALNDARKYFPNHVDIHLAEVWLLARKGEWDAAQKKLETMLKAKEDAEVRAMLGRIFLARGNDAGALESFRLAAEKASVKPTLIQARIYTMLGRALAKGRDHANAIEAYRQALAASSKYAEAYYWLGMSLVEQRRNQPAKEAFETLLQLTPRGKRADSARLRLSALN